MPDTLGDRFCKEVGAFFRKMAHENGLGLGINGTHTTRRHGVATAVTLFGWCGEMAVAIIFGMPEDWRLICRGYLLWCAGPGAEGVEPSRLPPPLGECVVTGPDDVGRIVRRGLTWLRSRTLVEAQVSFARECLPNDAMRGAS